MVLPLGRGRVTQTVVEPLERQGLSLHRDEGDTQVVVPLRHWTPPSRSQSFQCSERIPVVRPYDVSTREVGPDTTGFLGRKVY